MKRRIIDIVISVLAGIAIWVYVVSVLDPVSPGTIKAVPVQLTNRESLVSSGLAIAGTGEYTVDVVVTANRSTINALGVEDFVATADLTGLTKGQNYISVNVIAPGNVTVTEVRTQNIQVYVDTAVSVEKNIRIVPEKLAEGTELGSVKMSDTVVTLSGAQSLVEAVSDIRAVINTEGMTVDEPVSNEYKLIPVNSEGSRILGVSLSLNSVTIDSVLYHTKEVALNVPIEGELNEHISVRSEIIPASVTIRGAGSKLAEIWQIDAKPINRSDVVESGSIPIELILPDGIERAWASENLSVDYELKGRIDKSLNFGVDNIEAENLPQGFSIADFDGVNMVFSVYDDEAEAFGLDMVKLKIDFTDAPLGQGDYTYEIVIDEAMEDVIINQAPDVITINLVDTSQKEIPAVE